MDAVVRDFVCSGTGLAAGSQGYAMVFNLLHLEAPIALLKEAYRTLQAGGVLAVIHWRRDIDTPRGPPLTIRPTIEQSIAWMDGAGLKSIQRVELGGIFALPLWTGGPATCAYLENWKTSS